MGRLSRIVRAQGRKRLSRMNYVNRCNLATSSRRIWTRRIWIRRLNRVSLAFPGWRFGFSTIKQDGFQSASRQAAAGITPWSALSRSRTGSRSPCMASRKTQRANSRLYAAAFSRCHAWHFHKPTGVKESPPATTTTRKAWRKRAALWCEKISS